MANEGILVEPLDFLSLAKQYGFIYEKLTPLLAYSLSASGLDMTYSKQVRYGDPFPMRILFVGPLALPVNHVFHTTKKSVTNPETAFTHALELSCHGTKWDYLPPIEDDELGANWLKAAGYYTIWLYNRAHLEIGSENGN